MTKIMDKIRMHSRVEPTLEQDRAHHQPVDMDELAERLRNAPPLERPANEFAPQRAEYSIDRVASFLSRHIKELDETRIALAAEHDDAKAHLAEVERRIAVTLVAHEALAETVAKLTEKGAALDRPLYVKPTITEVSREQATS